MCVIRVGNTGTTSNSEVTEVALNITTSKKDENCTVDCLEPFDLIFKMTIRSNSINVYRYVDSTYFVHPIDFALKMTIS